MQAYALIDQVYRSINDYAQHGTRLHVMPFQQQSLSRCKYLCELSSPACSAWQCQAHLTAQSKAVPINVPFIGQMTCQGP